MAPYTAIKPRAPVDSRAPTCTAAAERAAGDYTATDAGASDAEDDGTDGGRTMPALTTDNQQ